MNYYETQQSVVQAEPPHKQKKGRAFIVTLLAVLVLAAVGVLIYNYFVAGQPNIDVTVSAADVSDDRIELSGSFNGFAGLKDYSYTIDEDTVVIELYSALPVAGLSRDFSIELTDDFSGIYEIDLSDGRNSLVVWVDDPAYQQSFVGNQ